MTTSKWFYPISLMLVIILLGIGYSAFTTEMNIKEIGLIVRPKSDIRITGISIDNATENVISSYEEYNINTISTKIELPSNSSTITYKINVTNFEEPIMALFAISGLHDDLEYYFENYELREKICDVDNNCNLGVTKELLLTIKYKDTTSPPINTVFDINLSFIFENIETENTLSGIEFNYLVKNGSYAPEGDVEEYYSTDANRLKDYSIKKITFGKYSDYASSVTNLVAEPIDVYRTGTINLYRENIENDLYNIYILSETGEFILNENSSWMFDKLYELEEIVNLHLLDTSNVTNMRDMFCDCAKLTNVDLSNFDTSKVTNMIGMFARMTSIEYLDLSTFNTENVEKIGQIFSGSSILKKIYVSDKWNITDKVDSTNGGGMFSSCTSLVGGNGTVLSTTVDKSMAVVDSSSKAGYLTGDYKFNTGIEVNHKIKAVTQEQIDSWTLSTRFVDTSVVEITFGKLRDFYEIVSNYTPSYVDSDNSGAIRLYRVPVSTEKYHIYILSNSGNFKLNTDSSWYFDNLIFLKKINNLEMLDTSKVQNFRDMFCDCQYLENLNLSNFNTISATSFEGMFARMYTIEELDMSSFKTNNLTTIKNMFSLSVSDGYTHESLMNTVAKMSKIYVSNNWDISKVAITDTVFAGAQNLVGGNGTIFDSTKVTAAYAVIDTATTPGYFTLK